MARQICPLSFPHVLVLTSVCFAAFLIQSNESLIPQWGIIPTSSPSPSLRQKNTSVKAAFFRRNRPSSPLVAVFGGAGDSDESPSDGKETTPVIFFADSESNINADAASSAAGIVADANADEASHNGVHENGTTTIAANDRSTLERYVESRVAAAKAKDEEVSDSEDNTNDNDDDSDATTTATTEAAAKEEHKEDAGSKDEEKARTEEEATATVAAKILEEKTAAAEEKARAEEEKRISAEKIKKAEEEEQAEKERRAKLEEEVRIADELREAQIREWTEKAVESVEKVIKPLSEIQDGVPAERIKGAAIAATALTLLASKGVLASSAVGLSAAYVSISKSVAGDVLRTVGGITWDVTETATKLADQFGLNPVGNFGEVDRTVVNKYRYRYRQPKQQPTAATSSLPNTNQTNGVAPGSDVVDEAELAFIEAEDDDDLARVLREAESVIGEADAAIAKAEADQKKSNIEKEEAKLAAKEEVAAAAAAAATREAEEEDKARITEEERIVEEAKQLKAEEEEKVRIAEKERIAEKARQLKAEEEEKARIAELAKLKVEEEERIARETLLAQDDDEDDDDNEALFDDNQFMAAVELAQEGIEGKIVGVDEIIADDPAKDKWDAASAYANKLTTSVKENDDDNDTSDDDLISYWDDEEERNSSNMEGEDDDEFGDIDFEALGKAAREAVEAYENDAEKVNEASLSQKLEWADSMIKDDDEDDDSDFEDFEVFFPGGNLDELARAAREAVEASSNDQILDVDDPIVSDYSALKVVELKAELKKRGLKTTGKKADLVSLLESDDISNYGTSEGEDDSSDDDVNIGDDETINLKDFDIEELGRQAREMIQLAGGDFDEEPTEEMLAELESEMAINGSFYEEPKATPAVDITKMTVAQLKDECRNRGLKVGGRKAELIERLENSTD